MDIQRFHKNFVGAALNALPSLSSSIRARQEEKLTSCCKVVIYLLTLYAMDDIIDQADNDIMNFNRATGRSAVEYAHALWTKALLCGTLYELHLKKFIEGIR